MNDFQENEEKHNNGEKISSYVYGRMPMFRGNGQQ